MKITRSQLKSLIKEEMNRISEVARARDYLPADRVASAFSRFRREVKAGDTLLFQAELTVSGEGSSIYTRVDTDNTDLLGIDKDRVIAAITNEYQDGRSSASLGPDGRYNVTYSYTNDASPEES